VSLSPQPRLTVVFAVTGFPGGGIETYILRLGGWLRAQGCAVHVLVTLYPGAWFPKLQAAGLHPVWVDALATGLAGVWQALQALAPSVILANHDPALMALAPFLPVPVVPVVHLDTPEALAASVVFAPGNAKSLALGGPTIAVSHRVAEALWAATGQPAQVIWNPTPGWDPAVLAGVGGCPAPLPRDPLRLLYVGRLHEAQKGVFLLPPLWAALGRSMPQVSLTLVGDGPDREPLLAAFADLGLRPRWLGMCPPDVVAREMAQASLLLFPSRFEGMPLVLLEALQAGCLPVSSILPGITDALVLPGQTGWLATGLDNFIATTLAALQTEPARLAAMRREAQRLAAEKFSLEAIGQQYMARLRALPAPGSWPQAMPEAVDMAAWQRQIWAHPEPDTAVALRRLCAQGLGLRASSRQPLVLYGAGKLARWVQLQLATDPPGQQPVAIWDQNLEFQGQTLAGVPITSVEAGLARLRQRTEAPAQVWVCVEGRHRRQALRWLRANLPSPFRLASVLV
jgi:glycosyltransferase involved in cell wall biosynthesis